MAFLHSALRYSLFIIGLLSCLICIYHASGMILHYTTDSISADDVVAVLTKKSGANQCHKADLWTTNSKASNRLQYINALWGSYSPGKYFGMKTATSGHALSTGIMWTSDFVHAVNTPRHFTNQDELDTFEWTEHDGSSLGVENIVDSQYGLAMNASFVQMDQSSSSFYEGESPTWMQQFEVTPFVGKNSGATASLDSNSRKSLFFYFGVECSSASSRLQCLEHSGLSHLTVMRRDDDQLWLYGHSVTTGWFLLHLSVSTGESGEGDQSLQGSKPTLSFAAASGSDTNIGAERLVRDAASVSSRGGSRRQQAHLSKSLFDHFGDLNNMSPEADATFVAVQVAFAGRPVTVRAVLFERLHGMSSLEDIRARLERTVAVDETQAMSAVFAAFAARKAALQRGFDEKFSTVFPLRLADSTDDQIQTTINGQFTSDEVLAARRALSSVLGGIGHFYGSPRLGDSAEHVEDPSQEAALRTFAVGAQEPISLLTGTPSRTVFPRGFLWDEGFHQLLVSRWDSAIAMQVLSDWLHAMHHTTDKSCSGGGGGWIPREMILGDEATRRVPDEFITQRVDVANPPTLLLVVDSLVSRLELDRRINDAAGDARECSADQVCEATSRGAATGEQEAVLSFLRDIYPLLRQWVQWYLDSQSGSDRYPGSFRWRGRSLSDQKVLPNTLASGLDDYPRAALPSAEEHHLDLHCWMIAATRTMARLGTLLAADVRTNSTEFAEIADMYAQQNKYLRRRLDELHWSSALGNYFDVGMHSENASFAVDVYFKCSNPTDNSAVEVPVPVEIARGGGEFCPPSHPKVLFPLGDGNGGYKMRERYVMDPATVRLQHVPRVGYVTLFPLLLRVVDPLDGEKLSALLDVVESPDALWTEHGLRSIAATDRYYHRRNSPGDAPYWRGPIWINVNYLAISALHHYGGLEGPQQARAARLYGALRANVQRTVLGQYAATGLFWEQYDDQSGRGMRGHPFTGWTALVLNIMVERYH